MKRIILVAMAPLLAACGSEERYDPNAALSSCKSENCQEQLADLQAQIKQLPEVASAGLRYMPGKPSHGPTVTGEVHLKSTDSSVCDALIDPIGELAWNSDVAPLDGVDLACFAREASNSEYVDLSWVIDPESFRDSWGERG